MDLKKIQKKMKFQGKIKGSYLINEINILEELIIIRDEIHKEIVYSS